MGRSSPAHDDLPASEDPSWAELGDEILDLLVLPQTISQLKLWARSRKLEVGRLINGLAWLDLRGRVSIERLGDEEAIWRRADAPEAQLPKRAIPKCCPRCKGRWKVEPQRLACMICGHSVYPPLEIETEEDRY